MLLAALLTLLACGLRAASLAPAHGSKQLVACPCREDYQLQDFNYDFTALDYAIVTLPYMDSSTGDVDLLEVYDNGVLVYSSTCATVPFLELAPGLHQLDIRFYCLGALLPMTTSTLYPGCPAGYAGLCVRFEQDLWVCICQSVL